jgi:hypothetical protein
MTVIHGISNKPPNEGTWRHSIVKYLRGPGLSSALTELLDL